MDVRITPAMLVRRALADVSRQRERLSRTQEQASSGLRVNRPSDDPASASAAMLLDAGIAATKQYARNVGRGQARLSTTEAAIANAQNQLLRARELAVMGANGTHDATSRAQIAAEVESLFASVLSEANSSYLGSHLFAGFSSDAAPFTATGTFDASVPSVPSISFVGDANELQLQIDEGVTVRVGFNGQRVFQGDADGDSLVDAGKEDVFGVLSDLWTALVTNDPTAVAAALPRIDASIAQLSRERTAVGAATSQLDDWESRLAEREVDLAARLSEMQDADMAEVLSNLLQQEAVLEAGLQTMGRMVQLTLLDFLS